MVNYYGLILGLVFVVGFVLIKLSSNPKVRAVWDDYYWLIITLTIIGARIYHVLDKLSYYQLKPVEVIYLWQGGLSYWGALIGLLTALLIINRRHRIDFLLLSDPIFTYLPLMQAFGRLANWANQEVVGWPVKGTWGIYLPSDRRPPGLDRFAYYQPAFLYEALLDLGLFCILVLVRRRHQYPTGWLTGVYFAGYGLIRLVTEFIRLPLNSFIIGDFNINLTLAIWMTLLGGWLIYRLRRI